MIADTGAAYALTLTLPVQDPRGLLTANGRQHWRHRARWSKHWRELTHYTALNLLRQHQWVALDRAHITCTITWPDKRIRDAANYSLTAKPIVDGLVDAGLLEDDNDRHVVGPDMRRGYGLKGSGITITIDITPLDT